MKIASTGRPSFGAPSSKPIPKKVSKRIEKTEKLAKKAKALEVSLDTDEEDEDDDYEEVSKPAPPKGKHALAVAPVLGIQDFEVHPFVPPDETVLPEETEGDSNYDNVRKNNSLIAAPTQLPGSPRNSRVRAARTMFGQRADKILGLLESEDSTDGALTLIQRTLLQTMVDVLPVIERSVRKTHGRRGVVPLNQTVSQVRELVGDIQALRDRGQLGASIVERVLRPSFLDIGVQLALAFNSIELSAKSRMSEKDCAEFMETLNEVKRGLASYIQVQYTEVKNQVASALS